MALASTRTRPPSGWWWSGRSLASGPARLLWRWRFTGLAVFSIGTEGQAHSLPAALPGAASFEAFFRRHERDIFSYLWRITSDEASAYDLTQETFVRAWQRFDKVAGYERPGAWLFRVATNLALNHLRQRRSPVGAALTLDERDHASDDPARGVVESDLVRRALMAMAPRQRAALVLREVYGLTGEELATTLGLSVGATKTLLWRAREDFRARYLRDAADSGAHRKPGKGAR